jgi:hypothetical protein
LQNSDYQIKFPSAFIPQLTLANVQGQSKIIISAPFLTLVALNMLQKVHCAMAFKPILLSEQGNPPAYFVLFG